MSEDGAERTVFEAVGDAMRAIPGPTDAWAEIVGHVAWPVTVIGFAFILRRELKRAGSHLAERLRTDDFSGLGFSVRQPTQVSELAQRDQPPTASDDPAVKEQLLEFAESEPGYRKMIIWAARNLGADVTMDAFLNEFAYIMDRKRALEELTGGERDG